MSALYKVLMVRTVFEECLLAQARRALIPYRAAVSLPVCSGLSDESGSEVSIIKTSIWTVFSCRPSSGKEHIMTKRYAVLFGTERSRAERSCHNSSPNQRLREAESLLINLQRVYQLNRWIVRISSSSGILLRRSRLLPACSYLPSCGSLCLLILLARKLALIYFTKKATIIHHCR